MRILLADDQAEVRSALRLLLGHEPELLVVGEVTAGAELLPEVRATRPDLVLLDWELPGLQRSQLSALRTFRPHLLVVALSCRPEARHAALEAGADAFVSKGDPPERLLAAMGNCRRECQIRIPPTVGEA